jgi:2-polyprenyl-3-methyl-5-hydroxy-6-metoxy-1,4-benzoquinol methylase
MIQPKGDFEYTNCMVCGSDEYEKYSDKGQFNLDTHVVICKKCGFSYLNPRWTIDRYNLFYSKEYDKYYREETVSNPTAEIEFASVKTLLKRLEQFELTPSSPINILDIGSGMGHTLIYLKKNVFQKANYFAIEPSETCIQFLKVNGIEVVTNDVYSSWEQNNGKKFDVVIMRHVLEHFSTPIEILNKVKSVLKDNGLLYVAVPNSFKPTKPLKSHYFRVVHVSYFSPVSLRNIFNKSGLDTVALVPGDSHEQFEIFAFCRTGEKKEIIVDKTQFTKQKAIYDEVGKKDFYYGFKAKVIKLLRKLKILK